MNSYLNILENILNNGKPKYPTRSIGNVGQMDGSVKTLALPNVHFEHHMSNGFPLLTTKKMAFKTICVELEGFIQGITDKSWYKSRGCHIWDGWANPKAVKEIWDDHCEYMGDFSPMEPDEKLYYQSQCNDLGPIYGAQWRNFDGDTTLGPVGYDQLKYIVDTLKTNPYDRRMVCSAWNPNQFDEMALVPCHTQFNVCVIGDEINLAWTQRSNDFFLGNPFNIASYGLLLTLLAKEANLKPGLLSAMFVDCHIYENQLDVVKEQLTREPYPLPQIEVGGADIFSWTHKDVKLINYKCHPQLKCEVIV